MVGEILESKLRQNLAEALSAKLNALEKARKATDKLKALKERCSKDSINSELITRQRVEINDLKLKMASLRGMINKQSTGVISSFSIMTGDTSSFYFFTSAGLLGKDGRG